MSDRIYLLKDQKYGTYYSKFYTSPYTAVLSGEVLRLGSSDPENTLHVPEMFVLDIEDVPCDHTVIKEFVTGFTNFVHRTSHEHGIVLLEENTCLFDVRHKGSFVGRVVVLYIPPSLDPDAITEVGEPVFRIIESSEKIDDLALRMLERMFIRYCENNW